jgi:hypothetical protein
MLAPSFPPAFNLLGQEMCTNIHQAASVSESLYQQTVRWISVVLSDVSVAEAAG